jgi:hypothetical protein
MRVQVCQGGRSGSSARKNRTFGRRRRHTFIFLSVCTAVARREACSAILETSLIAPPQRIASLTYLNVLFAGIQLQHPFETP